MKSKKRLRLAIILIICAIIISFAIATFDYIRQKQFVLNNHQFLLNQIEDTVVNSIITIEKAYDIFDGQTVDKMENHMQSLFELYEKNSNFDEWDFELLHEDFGMDVYIINEQNVVTHSNLQSDIGLDFKICCKTLSTILDERRMSGELYIDRMDIEQETGALKMYSYMATPDKKYIIELGYDLQDGEIFNEFNFLTVVQQLKNVYSTINDIHILNLGGLTIGKSADHSKVSPERREKFEEALAKNEIVEIEGIWQGEAAMYRYVPYVSAYDFGSSQQKVIEIIYNDHELQSVLSENRKVFFIQLLTVLFVIFIVSFVIHRWVAKQVYFAYHDSLTSLKNRAAFNEHIVNTLEDSKGNTCTALMMIDLDNFKLVNDYLGHDRGDYLLTLIGQTIRSSVIESGEAFRLGGDEFAVILPNTTEEETEKIALTLLQHMAEATAEHHDINNLDITASIGICFAPEHSLDPKTLYKQADIALYRAKEKGKNQYCLYSSDLLTFREKKILNV